MSTTPERQPTSGSTTAVSHIEAEEKESYEDGITLVEIALGITLFMIGVLGFVGATVSAQVMVRATKERNIASTAIISTIEEFREECAQDFVNAINTYESATGLNPDRLAGLGGSANMSSIVVLDEANVNPPLDLDGNGVFLDVVDPLDANAAVLRVRVAWQGPRGRSMDVEFTTIVAKDKIW